MLDAIKRFLFPEPTNQVRVRAIIPEACLGHKTKLKQGETAVVDRELAELLIWKGQAERV